MHLLSFDESKGGEKGFKMSKIVLKLENLKQICWNHIILQT